MPYRYAGPGLCAVCNSFTEGCHCPRCGRALCTEHAPDDSDRCADCEAEYVQLVQLVRSVPIRAAVVQVGLVAKCCVLLILVGQLDVFSHIGGAYLSLAGGAMALTFITALGVIWVRRRSIREHFMGQYHESHTQDEAVPDLEVPSLPRAAPLMVRW